MCEAALQHETAAEDSRPPGIARRTFSGGRASSTAGTAQWPAHRVVLSHDWLTGMRGGERCLELICRGYPEAPILALLANPGAVSDTITSHPLRTSPLQRVPGVFRNYRLLLPFFPAAVAALPSPPADLLISTSHCVAKAVKPPPGARHLCYCFTPMRYAWCFFDEYFGGNPLKALLARPLLAALRRWDRTVSSRVDRFVAISRHIQARIQSAYGRDSDVVYPPVDLDRCTPASQASADFDLVVSALVPYKRIDLVIRAYNRIGFPLVVAGTGTERRKLEREAGSNIRFLGWQTDEDVLELYRNCRQLIFPGEEDFGIVPVEAQACGRPVVAYARGGALETVRPDVSGVFFDEQTEDALADAVQRAAVRAWDPAAIRANAAPFGVPQFIDGLTRSIEACCR